MILIIGKPDSGKSALAEDIVQSIALDNPKYYIATMIPLDDEGKKRIAKHRAMRQGKGFVTLEWPRDLNTEVNRYSLNSDGTALLECMSNLAGNEMYAPVNKGRSTKELTFLIAEEISCLQKQVKNLVIVSNDFYPLDESYDEETKDYVKLVDLVNKELTRMADTYYVIEDGEWQKYENN